MDQEDGGQLEEGEDEGQDEGQEDEIGATADAQPMSDAMGEEQPLDTGVAAGDTAAGEQVQAEPMAQVAVDDEPAAATQQAVTADEEKNEEAPAAEGTAATDLAGPAEDEKRESAAENVEQKQVEQDNQTQD